MLTQHKVQFVYCRVLQLAVLLHCSCTHAMQSCGACWPGPRWGPTWPPACGAPWQPPVVTTLHRWWPCWLMLAAQPPCPPQPTLFRCSSLARACICCSLCCRLAIWMVFFRTCGNGTAYGSCLTSELQQHSQGFLAARIHVLCCASSLHRFLP